MTLCASVFFLAVAAIVCASGISLDKRGLKTGSHASLRASSVKIQVSTRGGSTSSKDVPSRTGTSLDEAYSGYKGVEADQESLTGVALFSRIRRVVWKIGMRLNLRMVEKDVDFIANTFLPEPRPSLAILWGSSALVVVVVTLWLAAYLSYFYQHDRDESLDRWKDIVRSPRLEKEDEEGVLPEFIIVFHHPGRHRKDDDMTVTSSTLEKCIVKNHPSRNTDNLMSHATSLYERRFRSQSQHRLAHEAGETTGKRRSSLFAEPTSSGPEQEPLGALRKSLLKDIITFLPGDGFDVEPFTSIDGEELFVGVSIKDPDSLRQMLNNDRMRLQLQHSVVNDILDIGQAKHEPESSPPFILYDAGLATKIGGPDCTDLEFYRTFFGADGGETIIGAKDRISIVRRRLECFVDIGASMHFGLLKDFYPVHQEHIITELEATWSNFKMLKDFTFVQPVNFLYRYVGPGYALRFAWNGLYCKMLLALFPVAMLFEMVHHLEVIIGAKFGLTFLCFSTILVIWSRIAHNLFIRDEQYFNTLWDVSDESEETKRLQPDFIGEKVESPVDSGEWSLEYPRKKKLLRRAASWICTFILCAFVQVGVYVWINVFEGHMDYVASGCLAVMINVIQLCYDPFAHYLTVKENHKFHHSFINSYTSKLVVFAFFNQYSVFFYIAIKMPYTDEGCPNKDCIGLLRNQLSMVFASLCALSIGLALSKYVKVQVRLWWQSSPLREWLGGSRRALGSSFLEEQSKYEENGYKQQAQATVQLIIPLGFVLLFGSIAPRIVPLCLLTFSIQLRAFAFLTTRCMRRPYPNVGGIDWSVTTEYIMTCGMSFSGFLWVAYGALFQHAQLITKLSSFIVFFFCMKVLWAVTDQFWPQTSRGEKLLKLRRAHVIHKLHDTLTSLEQNLSPRSSGRSSFSNDMDPAKKAILAGEWDRVGAFRPQTSPPDTPGTRRQFSRQASPGTKMDLSRK